MSWLWIVSLLLLGVVFLLAEVLLPGGIVGAFGAGFALAAVAMAGFWFGWDVAAALFVLCVVIGTIIIMFVLKHLPGSRLGRGLILEQSNSGAAGFVAQNQELVQLVGQTGVARSTLRPAGTATIAGQRIDVVTEGGFVQEGQPVRVVAVNGNRVVVRLVSPDAEQ
jgi:membrane-bound serine protease (ClpP class)